MASGNINGTGNTSLAISADKTADPSAVATDGAVVLAINSANPTLVTGVGAVGSALQVGNALQVGDVTNDGLDDVLFTEPGSATTATNKLYVIKGAATPTTTPNVTILNAAVRWVRGSSLAMSTATSCLM